VQKVCDWGLVYSLVECVYNVVNVPHCDNWDLDMSVFSVIQSLVRQNVFINVM